MDDDENSFSFYLLQLHSCTTCAYLRLIYMKEMRKLTSFELG